MVGTGRLTVTGGLDDLPGRGHHGEVGGGAGRARAAPPAQGARHVTYGVTPLELETKFKRGFAKISQSWRRPPLGSSPG